MERKELDDLNILREDMDRRFGDIKDAVNAGFAGLKDLLTEQNRSHGVEIQQIREEVSRLRDNDREHYELAHTLDTKIQTDITAARTSIATDIQKLEERIDVIEKEPGDRARDILKQAGMYVLLLIVGAGLYALWMNLSGGSPPPIP